MVGMPRRSKWVRLVVDAVIVIAGLDIVRRGHTGYGLVVIGLGLVTGIATLLPGLWPRR